MPLLTLVPLVTRETDGSGREPKKVREREEDFTAFWSAYPKKEAKGEARKAWVKLAGGGKLPPLGELVGAIEAQQRSRQWTDEGGRFNPHPAKWLRGERWADELDAPAPARSGRGAPRNWHPEAAADFADTEGSAFINTGGLAPGEGVN